MERRAFENRLLDGTGSPGMSRKERAGVPASYSRVSTQGWGWGCLDIDHYYLFDDFRNFHPLKVSLATEHCSNKLTVEGLMRKTLMKSI